MAQVIDNKSEADVATGDVPEAERVRFAQRLARKHKPDMEAMLPVYLGSLAFVTILVLEWPTTANPSGPVSWVSGAVLVPVWVAVMAIPAVRAYQRWRLRKAASVAAEEPDESGRLWCVGTPVEIQAEQGIPDVPFEPRVYRLWNAPPAMSAVGEGVYIVTLLVAGGFAMYFNYLMTGEFTRGAPLFVYTAIVLHFGLQVLLWPVYARVVPGRVELLSYGFLRRCRIIRVDLKKNRLIVDLRKRLAVIEAPDRDKPLEFSLALMPHRNQFAHDLFQAALSSYPPGPIDEDASAG